MKRENITRIGKIVNSHGVRGELKVLPLTDDFGMLSDLGRLFLLTDGHLAETSIVSYRRVKDHWLVRLVGVDDMSAAKELRDCYICVEDHALRPLADGEVFIHDLINSKVYSTENRFLGTVIRYFEAGSQGVCEVSTGEGTFLFPVTREVLREVEAPDRVVINLLPNLMEVNL